MGSGVSSNRRGGSQRQTQQQAHSSGRRQERVTWEARALQQHHQQQQQHRPRESVANYPRAEAHYIGPYNGSDRRTASGDNNQGQQHVAWMSPTPGRHLAIHTPAESTPMASTARTDVQAAQLYPFTPDASQPVSLRLKTPFIRSSSATGFVVLTLMSSCPRLTAGGQRAHLAPHSRRRDGPAPTGTLAAFPRSCMFRDPS